jgi:hypothetical protein
MSANFIRLLVAGTCLGIAAHVIASPPGEEASAEVKPQADTTDEEAQQKVIREISVEGKAKLPRSRTGKVSPTVIKSSAELAKLITNDEVRQQIAAQVDFATEHVLFFAWAGSGQDRLTTSVTRTNDAARVVISYQPGRTRDLRPHVHLFVIKQSAQWQVQKAR